jgi:hypothetical protein
MVLKLSFQASYLTAVHDDRRIDHGADGDRDAAEAHDIGAEAQCLHGGEGHQHADRQHEDRNEGAAHMQQEDDAHQGDDGTFFQEGVAKRLDGRVNESRAIVDSHDVHALTQAARDLADALLDVVYDIERVGAEALQHDAAGDLAIAVELGQASAFVRSQLYPRHVLNEHGRAAVVLENDGLAPTNSWWAAELPQATKDYNAWMAASTYLMPLAQKVDYIFPSLYTYYDPYSNGTNQDWQTFADQQIQAARMYGKPVYPFLWPQYHDAPNAYIPTDYWTNEIQHVASNADGVVVWGWSGFQHDSWND